MLIFWEHRLVFLATPKAGSTAIEVALESLANVNVQQPAALKHVTAGDYARFVAPWLEHASGMRFSTVALMREPVEWLRSWYRFRLRDDQEALEHAMDGIGFDGFARAYLQPTPPEFAAVGTQLHHLIIDGKPAVDRIFRYEDMPAFTRFMEDRLDCVISLPRVNVPPAVDVSLSDDTASMLNAAMADDFALYRTL